MASLSSAMATSAASRPRLVLPGARRPARRAPEAAARLRVGRALAACCHGGVSLVQAVCENGRLLRMLPWNCLRSQRALPRACRRSASTRPGARTSISVRCWRSPCRSWPTVRCRSFSISPTCGSWAASPPRRSPRWARCSGSSSLRCCCWAGRAWRCRRSSPRASARAVTGARRRRCGPHCGRWHAPRRCSCWWAPRGT